MKGGGKGGNQGTLQNYSKSLQQKWAGGAGEKKSLPSPLRKAISNILFEKRKKRSDLGLVEIRNLLQKKKKRKSQRSIPSEQERKKSIYLIAKMGILSTQKVPVKRNHNVRSRKRLLIRDEKRVVRKGEGVAYLFPILRKEHTIHIIPGKKNAKKGKSAPHSQKKKSRKRKEKVALSPWESQKGGAFA